MYLDLFVLDLLYSKKLLQNFEETFLFCDLLPGRLILKFFFAKKFELSVC